MTPEQITALVSRPESPVLEFKRDMYKWQGNPAAQRHKNEMVKDILALANNNGAHAGETAYLIVGADNLPNADGERDLFDVSDPTPKRDDVLKMVNAKCAPPLERLGCEIVEAGGKRLWVVTVPFSRYLHETTDWLHLPSEKRQKAADQPAEKTEPTLYSPHTVFIRHEAEIGIASDKERDEIKRMKAFRASESRKADPILLGVLAGAAIAGPLGGELIVRERRDETQRLAGQIGGAVAGGVVGAGIGLTFRDLLEFNSSVQTYPGQWRGVAWLFLFLISGGLSLLIDALLKRVIRGRRVEQT